jgi:hypothetical protein
VWQDAVAEGAATGITASRGEGSEQAHVRMSVQQTDEGRGERGVKKSVQAFDVTFARG